MTDHETESKDGVSRRGVLGGTAVAGAAALSGAGAYLEFARHAKAATSAGQSAEVKPGDLDEYYAFNSSGQTGEVRIQVLPSGARTDAHPGVQPRQRDGLGPDQREQENPHRGAARPRRASSWRAAAACGQNGDLHHPHMSFTDGTYDGRYIFVNDKANCRVARIRCDVMKTDKIIEIPNASDIHGLRPQKYPAHRLCLRQQRAHHPDPQRRQWCWTIRRTTTGPSTRRSTATR